MLNHRFAFFVETHGRASNNGRASSNGRASFVIKKTAS